jgi:hypothetical protein
MATKSARIALGVDAHQQEQSAFTFSKRVGSTTYRVNVFMTPECTESAEEKLLRCVKNDLNFAGNHGNIQVLQTGRSAERGSL